MHYRTTSAHSLRLQSAICQYIQADGDNGSTGKLGLYHRSEEVGLYKEGVQAYFAPSPFVLWSQGDEEEANTISDKGEKDKACVSDREAMILRSA